MNILPKKNWHVRKKENIARVRRDEAEAAEKEREIQRRAKLAEQEARLNYLRTRAHATKLSGSSKDDAKDSSEVNVRDLPSSLERKDASDIYTESGNINFFKEAELKDANTGTNKEYEVEKKAEKEDFEKKIGLLTYLGQDTYEATGKNHWYAEKDYMISKLDRNDDGKDGNYLEVGLKQKGKIDPLIQMVKFAGLNFHTKSYKKESFTPETQLTREEFKTNTSRLKKEKKKKKQRHKRNHSTSNKNYDSSSSKTKKKKRRNVSSESSSNSSEESEIEEKNRSTLNQNDSSQHKRNRSTTSSKNDSFSLSSKTKKKKRRNISPESLSNSSEESEIEEKRIKLQKMREERLKREAYEKKRQDRLLAGKNPDIEDETEKKSKLPYQQKYNSQFNPHLAKQNVKSPADQSTTTLKPGVKYWVN